MPDNEVVVTEPGSTPDKEEKVESSTGGAETAPKDGAAKDENRIPISRAEEMWKRREEKLRAEFHEKELGPLKKNYEETMAKLAKGQLGFMKEMGWYNEKPPEPLTMERVEGLLADRLKKVEEESRARYYMQEITSGWREFSAKNPKLASNKRLQDAAMYAYSQNPEVSIAQHAEAIVKELLDPYASEREIGLQKEKEKQMAPDRRVVPGGRGAAGGGGGKGEQKKTVAERILGRLREREG